MMLDIFNEENILLNQKFDNKKEAIIASGNILVNNNYVSEKYIDSMLERDERLTVYLGNNIAIPHGLVDSDKYIFKSGISFIQVPEGVMFGNDVVYIIIGIAGKNNSHIDILSKVAAIVSEEENIEKLRFFKTKKEVLDMFFNINE